MALLPYQRGSWLSDEATLQRLMHRPQTTVDALYLSQRDMILGLFSGLAGERSGRRGLGAYFSATVPLSKERDIGVVLMGDKR